MSIIQEYLGSAWLHQDSHDPAVGHGLVRLRPEEASHSPQEHGDPVHKTQSWRIPSKLSENEH